jgi:hypothetical protein
MSPKVVLWSSECACTLHSQSDDAGLSITIGMTASPTTNVKLALKAGAEEDANGWSLGIIGKCDDCAWTHCVRYCQTFVHGHLHAKKLIHTQSAVRVSSQEPAATAFDFMKHCFILTTDKAYKMKNSTQLQLVLCALVQFLASVVN